MSWKGISQQAFIGMLAERKGGKTFLQLYLDTFGEAARKPKTWQAKFVADRLFSEDVLEQADSFLNKQRREDMDFLSYRLHKGAFDIQQQVLLSKHRRIYLMAGRRAGKTDVNRRLIVDSLLRSTYDGGARVLYLGKTMTTAVEQIYQGVLDLLADIGLAIAEKRRNEGFLKLEDGGEFYVRGNSSTEEREKLRGFKWDRVIIDEAQSQTALPYLINDVIEPALVDRRGQIIVSGTGPRVRGTYWEMLWSEPEWSALKLNWNLTQNPYIEDHRRALAEIMERKGLTETSPLYVREYLGRIAYDDDALVLRLGEQNFFTDDELAKWIATQPVTDIKFVGGLDFGFTDADALGIVCYSERKPERFLVHEYKMRRTGVAELVDAVRAGIKYVETSPLFARVESKRFFIHADTSGKKISYDMVTQYKLPIQDAYKVNKDMAVELLQEDVRKGVFKVRRGGPFEDEAMKTIFKRNDRDELTREIDDETYHPDLIDAVTYAMRTVWWFGKRIGDTEKTSR